MPATRPGIHRITKQGLQRQKGMADKAVKQHVKGCPTCSKAGSDPYDHCSAWWALALDLHRIRRALRRYDAPETDNMDALFPVEQQ